MHNALFMPTPHTRGVRIAGYTYVPYSSLESVIEENKEAYYLALRRAQSGLRLQIGVKNEPNWEPWLLFFLRSLKTQKDRLMQKMAREQLLEGALPELSLRILEMIRERGRIQSSDVVKATGETRGTVRNRLNALVARGLIARHGQGPATWYARVSVALGDEQIPTERVE